jgi:hypothetical protein
MWHSHILLVLGGNLLGKERLIFNRLIQLHMNVHFSILTSRDFVAEWLIAASTSVLSSKLILHSSPKSSVQLRLRDRLWSKSVLYTNCTYAHFHLPFLALWYLWCWGSDCGGSACLGCFLIVTPMNINDIVNRRPESVRGPICAYSLYRTLCDQSKTRGRNWIWIE